MKNYVFECEKKGENSFATSNTPEGMEVDNQVEIDEKTDLSEIIKFNSNGCVYGINLKFNSGIYSYILNIDARGPKGMTSGSGRLIFTDASGDEYTLSITSSTRKVHTIKYNSRFPNIVKIRWESAKGVNDLTDLEIDEQSDFVELKNKEKIEKDLKNPNLKVAASWSDIIDWDIDFHLDIDNITDSYANINISLLGINIISTCLDFNNPKVNINAKIRDIGLDAELGIDFNKRIIYLKGSLDLIIISESIDLILLSF